MRVLYLHFVLLLALFTSCEATATSKGGACPLSRLQAAFQAPFNSLSLALHGQQTTASMTSNMSSRDRSPSLSDRSSSNTAPRWVTEGVRSRVVRSRTVDVQPLSMSAVETKPGSKRAAEGEPEEAKETKAQKKARRVAASSVPLSIHVVGLSHHNAGVDVREKLAVPEAEWNLASAKVRAWSWMFVCLISLGGGRMLAVESLCSHDRGAGTTAMVERVLCRGWLSCCIVALFQRPRIFVRTAAEQFMLILILHSFVQQYTEK